MYFGVARFVSLVLLQTFGLALLSGEAAFNSLAARSTRTVFRGDRTSVSQGGRRDRVECQRVVLTTRAADGKHTPLDDLYSVPIF